MWITVQFDENISHTFFKLNSSSTKPNNTKYSQLKLKLNAKYICI